MIIDGKKIAQEILDDLKLKVEKLRTNNVHPHLHIITLTTDSASESYVWQKKKKGEEIGAKITVENLDQDALTEQLLERIEKLNSDKSVHGIIVQRPFSPQIDEQKIANSINPEKDVDGFHPESKFDPPISESVLKILEQVYRIKSQIQNSKFQINSKTQNIINKNVLNFDNSNLDIISDLNIRNLDFFDWLRNQSIAVIGRGVTAGGPIIQTLQKKGIEPSVITSKTENKTEILKNSDIVICAVGKSDTLRSGDIKNGTILIGVGMFKGGDGKFYSDYEEDDIKDIASFYTPTPGGVGPVNVAQLLSNLVKASENFIG